MAMWKQIIIAIILGLLLGWAAPATAVKVKVLGDIFISLMKMLLVPLVFFSLISGVITLGDVKMLRTIGWRVVCYFLITSLFSAILGCGLALLLKPGVGVSLGEAAGTGASVTYSYDFVQTLLSWIPSNIISSMADAAMVPVIFFAVFFGVCLLSVADKVPQLISIMDQCNITMLKMTEYVVKLSPIGIFGLTAQMVPSLSGKMVASVVRFVLVDISGVALVFLVVYPLLLKLMANINPITFFKNISDVTLFAAASASSAATLPLALNVADKRLGISEKVYGFALPLGNTCNMNAAAIAQAAVAVFAFNVYGQELSFGVVFQAVILALLLSIGTAGVKGAPMVMSTVLLETFGLPLDLIAILGAIWPIVDWCNTATNVTGDVVGTAIVAKQLNLIDKDSPLLK